MFYLFDQNNSGGSFRRPAMCVFIEADNADEANDLAHEHGIYFEGCYSGSDCPCCGDRWYRADDDEGTETPQIYGKHPKDHKFYGRSGVRKYIIVYKDGKVEGEV